MTLSWAATVFPFRVAEWAESYNKQSIELHGESDKNNPKRLTKSIHQPMFNKHQSSPNI